MWKPQFTLAKDQDIGARGCTDGSRITAKATPIHPMPRTWPRVKLPDIGYGGMPVKL